MKTNTFIKLLLSVFLIIPATAGANLIAADLYSAQVAVGFQGKLFAKTELGLMNRSDRAVPVRASFYTSDGLPFQVRLVNPGFGASENSVFELQLPPRGNLNLTVLDCLGASGSCRLAQLQTGYVRFELEDTESVEIETVFVNVATENAKTATAAAVSARPLADGWFFNSRISETFFFLTGQRIRVDSGLAIANPNESSSAVTVTLFMPDGSEYDSVTFIVPPGQQRARFITELFPNLIPSLPSGFGSFRIGIQASIPVALLALRADISDDFLISGVPVFVTD